MPMHVSWLTAFLLILVLVPGNGLVATHATEAQPRAKATVIEDFESYEAGGLPTRWHFIDRRQQLIPVTPDIMDPTQHFVVMQERGDRFLRAVTVGRAHRLVLMNGEAYRWDVREHPVLRWNWRAHTLPQGANEEREETNDTGGAVYVTFSKDWLGRPRSIKYSYSSTLPIGTVADYGRLKVLVVASGRDGIGKWHTMERDIVADYRQLFGGDPPDEPISIMLWSDSNTVSNGEAQVDFDDLVLAPTRR